MAVKFPLESSVAFCHKERKRKECHKVIFSASEKATLLFLPRGYGGIRGQACTGKEKNEPEVGENEYDPSTYRYTDRHVYKYIICWQIRPYTKDLFLVTAHDDSEAYLWILAPWQRTNITPLSKHVFTLTCSVDLQVQIYI